MFNELFWYMIDKTNIKNDPLTVTPFVPSIMPVTEEEAPAA